MLSNVRDYGDAGENSWIQIKSSRDIRKKVDQVLSSHGEEDERQYETVTHLMPIEIEHRVLAQADTTVLHVTHRLEEGILSCYDQIIAVTILGI